MKLGSSMESHYDLYVHMIYCHYIAAATIGPDPDLINRNKYKS